MQSIYLNNILLSTSIYIDLFYLKQCYFIFSCTEKMAANIREEIRRLQRRKQLHFHPQTNGGDSSDMEGPSSPGSSLTPFSHSSSGKEKPLFTFRQVEFLD